MSLICNVLLNLRPHLIKHHLEKKKIIFDVLVMLETLHKWITGSAGILYPISPAHNSEMNF